MRYFTELSLVESEAMMRQITNQMADVVYVSDLNLNVQYVSPSIEKLIGCTLEEHVKKPLNERYTADSIAKLWMFTRKELEREKDPNADKERTVILDLQMIKASGELVDVSIHTSLIRDADGKSSGFQGIIRDVTARKNAEKALKEREHQLKQLVADKDRFMQIISHDLRAPFQTLMGFSELLLSTPLNSYSEGEIKNMLKLINQTSHNTFYMFDNLLMWAKAEGGSLKVEYSKLNLSELCSSVMDEVEIMARHKNVSLINNTDQEYEVRLDENIIRTVLRNIITNAIKFSYPGSHVAIDTVVNGNIEIIVTDMGKGISEEDLKNMWSRDSNMVSEGTAREIGTGTGLMLCKQLIERHGGNISVASKIDEGSSFKITLPNAKA